MAYNFNTHRTLLKTEGDLALEAALARLNDWVKIQIANPGKHYFFNYNTIKEHQNKTQTNPSRNTNQPISIPLYPLQVTQGA